MWNGYSEFQCLSSSFPRAASAKLNDRSVFRFDFAGYEQIDQFNDGWPSAPFAFISG